MLNLDASKKIDGVYYLSSSDNAIFDEDSYILVRKREGRFYPDSVVKDLPSIEFDHHLKDEWAVRERSVKKISEHIKKNKFGTVLDVGCGNGWFSNSISKSCNCFTAGLDLNQAELAQAARVFGRNDMVKFIYGNIFEDIFPIGFFDIIIFAASIQYFSSFNTTITSIFRFLKPGGEIHIIDSNFYDDSEIESARVRSRNYYNQLGIPVMAEYYFHHSWNELEKFDYRLINHRNYRLSKFLAYFGSSGSIVFPWIVIKPQITN